jgi:hypothetical protein
MSSGPPGNTITYRTKREGGDAGLGSFPPWLIAQAIARSFPGVLSESKT